VTFSLSNGLGRPRQSMSCSSMSEFAFACHVSFARLVAEQSDSRVRPNQEGQSDMSVGDAVDMWWKYMEPLANRGFKLGRESSLSFSFSSFASRRLFSAYRLFSFFPPRSFASRWNYQRAKWESLDISKPSFPLPSHGASTDSFPSSLVRSFVRLGLHRRLPRLLHLFPSSSLVRHQR